MFVHITYVSVKAIRRIDGPIECLSCGIVESLSATQMLISANTFELDGASMP